MTVHSSASRLTTGARSTFRSVEHCPPDLIRFQSWDIRFTNLYEGGPDRETTAARTYSQLFGDKAACAITTDGEIDCWSDFRSGDPRQIVPERFRPLSPLVESEPPDDEGDQDDEDDQDDEGDDVPQP